MPNPPFVGRVSELGIIARQMGLLQKGERRVVNIDGEKGIGKTYLLREACRIYAGDDRIAVALVDFDSGYPHLRLIRDHIASQFGGAIFSAYQEMSKEEAYLEGLQDEYPARLNKIQTEASQRFYDCFRQLAKQKKILLAFDTCEKILDTGLLTPFLVWLTGLDNTLVLLAGYRNAELQRHLESYWSQEAIVSLTLQALGTEDFKECLAGFAVSAELDESASAALEFLTERKPLLLHLAGMWLDRHIALPELVRRPLAELQSHAQEAKQQFEHELVSRIRELASPVDQAVLYMAYLISPPEPDLWVELLKIEPLEAERLNEELRDLFFVRADLTLHDVMRELVEKHVWAFVDRSGSQRKGLFGRLETYYRNREPSALGWERWVNKVTQLHYHLLTNFSEAFAGAMREFYTEIDKYRVYRELVLIELSRDGWKSQITPGQQVQLDNKCAYSFARQKRKAEALAQCQDILGRQGLDPDIYMEAHSIIGEVVTPEIALEHYQKALEIANRLGDWHQTVRMMRNLGRAYRRIGQLEEARKYYEQCIAQSIEHGDLAQKASSQNSLAYVYLQQGMPDWALNHARLALVAQQKAGEAPKQLGHIYQTISDIYHDMSQYETALQYLERAENAFQRAGDDQAQAGVWVSKARIYRRRPEPQRVDFLLKQAIEVLKGYDAYEDLCAAYNEQACELRRRGWQSYQEQGDREGAIRAFEQSELNFEASSRYAQEAENWFFLANNLSDQALLYYYWSEAVGSAVERQALIRKAEDTVQRTIRLSHRYGRYPLFESRAVEIRGEIAYSDGKYYKAFTRFYLQACALLSDAFGSSSARRRAVFDRVHYRLLDPKLPDSEVRRISLYMVRRWKEMGLDRVAPGFSEAYEAIAANYRSVERGDL